MSNRTRNRTDHSWVATGKSLLLLAVLIVQIQVPIPVIHDHESVGSPLALASHVRQRHADGQLSDLGNHLHWVLPRSGDDASHQPSSEEQDESLPTPAASADHNVVVSGNSAWANQFDLAVADLPTSCFATPFEPGSTLRKRSVAELTTVSAADLSCAVLCVIRC